MTKSKAIFPTNDSLFKMLYLAMLDITPKWTGRRYTRSSHCTIAAAFPNDRRNGTAIDNLIDLGYYV